MKSSKDTNENNEINYKIENQVENKIETNNNIMLLKFDNTISKYNEYFENLENFENKNLIFKTVNITDPEIIEFYDIDTIPSILIYKNKNLIGTIEGYFAKTELIKKIKSIIE